MNMALKKMRETPPKAHAEMVKREKAARITLEY
jgi:hypothetical protein